MAEVQSSPGVQSKARDVVTEITKFAAEFDIVGALDANVKSCLPPDSTDIILYPHGAAYWSQTAGIAVKVDGQRRRYFLKLSCAAAGLSNLNGEFECMKVIQKAIPGCTPDPIAVGTYASDPHVAFYLSSFVDMTEEVPDIDQLGPKFAELHRKAISPTGMYGFHVPSNMGACIFQNTWMYSWEAFFSNLMQILFQWEQDIHGRNEHMEGMREAIMSKVIPRLMRPLETEGRTIQPRMCHGDLWDGNASIDIETDQVIMFDAMGFYGHNEYDLGAWNHPQMKVYRGYLQEYQRHFPPSAPEEDVEDRLKLYTLRFILSSSMSYLDNTRLREIAIEYMEYLTDKYKDGYQGSARMKSGPE